jgi:hypothetical protein
MGWHVFPAEEEEEEEEEEFERRKDITKQSK